MLVIQQRSNWIIVPDVLLAQRVWGGDKKQWPANWRGNLAGRLGGSSPLKCQRACPPECPMHNSSVRHGHFHFKIKSLDDCQDRDQTFLGALESYGYHESGEWRYDLSKPRGPSEAYIKMGQEQIDKDKKAGRLSSVYLSVLVFGPAQRMKLSYERRQLLLSLTHELTRADQSNRPDMAQIIPGGQKSIGKEGTRVGVYPYLQPGLSYVGFTDNCAGN